MNLWHKLLGGFDNLSTMFATACIPLASTGSNTTLLTLLSAVLIIGGVAVVRFSKARTLILVLVLTVGTLALAGVAPKAASAACSTTTTTPATTTTTNPVLTVVFVGNTSDGSGATFSNIRSFWAPQYPAIQICTDAAATNCVTVYDGNSPSTSLPLTLPSDNSPIYVVAAHTCWLNIWSSAPTPSQVYAESGNVNQATGNPYLGWDGTDEQTVATFSGGQTIYVGESDGQGC